MKLILGFYSQQVEGSTKESLERVVNSALKVLLQKLYNNESLKITLGLSGYIMEWLEIYQPEITTLINTLVRKEQVELLSSSFYGSTLSLLPRSERSSQIEKTTTFIRKRYSKRPKGVWFYNQIWSPSYISTMNICSIKYTVLAINPKELEVKNEPFLMTNLGVTNCIVPSNFEFAQTIKNCFDNKLNTQEVLDKINQIKITKSAYMDYVNINLDQIIYEGLDSAKVIDTIINKYLSNNYFPNSVESSGILEKKEIKPAYLPTGCYGADIITSLISPEQIINKDKNLTRLNGRMFALREIIKYHVSDKFLKKELKNGLSKCVFSPAIFDKDYCQSYISNLEKKIGEVEHILIYNNCLVSFEGDIDFDNIKEYIYYGKSINAILDRKGGSLCSLFYNAKKRNFKSNSDNSLFSDKLIVNGEKINLSNAIYDVEIKDRKNSEIECSYHYNRNKFNFKIIKTYKFRSNSLFLNIKIQNLSNIKLIGYYYLLVPISCFQIENKHTQDYFEEKYKSFYWRRADDFSSTIATIFSQSDPFYTRYKDYINTATTPYKSKEDYYFTDLNLKWNINLQTGITYNLELLAKIEVNKEKKTNDYQ